MVGGLLSFYEWEVSQFYPWLCAQCWIQCWWNTKRAETAGSAAISKFYYIMLVWGGLMSPNIYRMTDKLTQRLLPFFFFKKEFRCYNHICKKETTKTGWISCFLRRKDRKAEEFSRKTETWPLLLCYHAQAKGWHGCSQKTTKEILKWQYSHQLPTENTEIMRQKQRFSTASQIIRCQSRSARFQHQHVKPESKVHAERSVKGEHKAQAPHLSIKLIWHQHAGLYENKCQLSRQGQFNLSAQKDDQQSYYPAAHFI